MKYLRSHHWLVTGVLFAVAMILYITGFSVAGAAVAAFFGFIVETFAWISLAFHTGERRSSSE